MSNDTQNPFAQLAAEDAQKASPATQPAQTPTSAPASAPAEPTATQGNPFAQLAAEDAGGGNNNTTQSQQPTATISAIKKPAHIGEALEQWTDNVLNDVKYGTDLTGVGSVLKAMGRHQGCREWCVAGRDDSVCFCCS